MDLITVVAICYLVISFTVVLLEIIKAIRCDLKRGDDFEIIDMIFVIGILALSWWVVWKVICENKVFSKLMSFTLIKGKK